jgi:hypothetical protein
LDVEIDMGPVPNKPDSQVGGIMLCDVVRYDRGRQAVAERMLLFRRKRRNADMARSSRSDKGREGGMSGDFGAEIFNED